VTVGRADASDAVAADAADGALVPSIPLRAWGRATHPSRRFWFGSAGAALVVGIALIITALARPARPEAALPLLAAAAFLCAALLVRRWAPSLAWLALVASALAAASVPLALSSGADPGALGTGVWLIVAGRSCVAAVATVGIAALYASRPERSPASWVPLFAALVVAWLIGACLLTIGLVLAGVPYDPAFTWVDVATWPNVVYIELVLLLTAVGALADLRAASDRAENRLNDGASSNERPRQPFDVRLRATLRELVPGQPAADAAAIEAERVRLAGDLHAVALPTLRRAIAEVEAGGPVETLAERLRTVDVELERLMADRWPVVLDAFGLVEALEELAERTEADGHVQVELDIQTVTGRPRPDVERTAYRFAQVALDNAVRHATASRIVVVVAEAIDRISLSVDDDGTGFDPADPIRAGARGLADLQRRAAQIGATVEIEARRLSGTTVRFEWRAPG
jgi:signal transduction histidine kinase